MKVRYSMNFIYNDCLKIMHIIAFLFIYLEICNEMINNTIFKNWIWKNLTYYSLICYLSLILSPKVSHIPLLWFLIFSIFLVVSSIIISCLEKDIVSNVFLSSRDLKHALMWGGLLRQIIMLYPCPNPCHEHRELFWHCVYL